MNYVRIGSSTQLLKKEVCVTMYMNSKGIVLSESNQTQNKHYMNSQNEHERVRLIGAESKMLVVTGWERCQ